MPPIGNLKLDILKSIFICGKQTNRELMYPIITEGYNLGTRVSYYFTGPKVHPISYSVQGLFYILMDEQKCF